ncbi:signal peptidase I [Lachnobacterium bovis]|uniref:Signal peptidase I n=1 Tax=Lachnobacterium bovis TaxID=140626 RepID=A0A1H9TRR7_9FIRM|nr:signal peptidase I [Lachnobacterium bovis]SER99714.1 signal peptidase I [Lachnobacterium bovis]
MFFKSKKGLDFTRKKRKVNHKAVRKVVIWTMEIVFVILLAFSVVFFFGKRVGVVGKAMETDLNIDDQILVNKFIYKVTKPKKDDVIVFKPNGNKKSQFYLRRVIATPGDTVQIKNGMIYVNDKMLQENRKVESIENPGLANKKIKLKKDEYFVLGDNRNNSEDSRYSSVGNVKAKHIEGKAWLRVVPMKKIGFVK